jgi:DNA polymerase elongation subunit (family B)
MFKPIEQMTLKEKEQELEDIKELLEFSSKVNVGYALEHIFHKTFDDKILKKFNYTIAANGCLYRRDKQGFMAALMETKFKDRAALKKKMFSVIKRIEKFEGVAEELEQLKKDKSKYKNKQLAKKIQLNSLYGALLNEYFRWFSVENGEAITHTGQLVITFVVKMLNKLLNELFKTVDVDYVVASDTDSAYVCLDKYAETLHEVDEQIIADKIDDFCKKKIEPYLQKCFEDVAQTMNGYAQKLHMKREVIATKVVWTSKKHYIMNVIDDEGTRYEVPKLKVVGMESVRSSTPNACRKALEKGYELVLNGDQDPLMDFIDNFKEEFVSLPFVLKATPRGVNGMDRYEDEDTVYKIRTPQHVKAALLFNALLKKHDLINIPPIWNGDKIKFFPLRMPNPIGDEVIALPDNIPKELEYLTKFFDYDAQFNKMFFEPLKTVTKAVGWDIENKNSLEKFFI